ncbi:hypothetical protein Esti_001760 [Eimeria stiedai]
MPAAAYCLSPSSNLSSPPASLALQQLIKPRRRALATSAAAAATTPGAAAATRGCAAAAAASASPAGSAAAHTLPTPAEASAPASIAAESACPCPQGRLRVAQVHAAAARARQQQQQQEQRRKQQPQEQQQQLLAANVAVCGWIETLREGGGGSLLFLDVSDGSATQPLQCIVPSAAAAAAAAAAATAAAEAEPVAALKPRRSLRRGDAVCLRGSLFLVPTRPHIVELRVAEANSNSSSSSVSSNDSSSGNSSSEPCCSEPSMDVKTWELHSCVSPASSFLKPSAAPSGAAAAAEAEGAAAAAEAAAPGGGDAAATSGAEGGWLLQHSVSTRSVSLAHLRQHAVQLRARHAAFAAVMRIRAQAEASLLRFLDTRGFLRVQTPILTGLDCEGAGKTFRVSSSSDSSSSGSSSGRTLLGKPMFLSVSGQLPLEALAWGLGDVYSLSPAFRAEYSNTQRHLCEFWMLEAEASFVDRPTLLHFCEELVQQTTRHVLTACRPELTLIAAHNCSSSSSSSSSGSSKSGCIAGHLDLLHSVASQPFAVITYAEALRRLRLEGLSPRWGDDLGADEEKLLLRQIALSSSSSSSSGASSGSSGHERGVVIVDHPRILKPFYMRVNPDSHIPADSAGDSRSSSKDASSSSSSSSISSGATVASLDLLLPKAGEVMGGSMREERLSVLDESLKLKGLSAASYGFYRDLRLVGSAPRGGFGLGIERLLLFLTGLKNVKDLVPFPRAPHYAPL